MCLIIHSPAETVISDELINTAFSHNHDGWGVLAYTEEGLYVKKGFNLKKLRREVRKLNEKNTEVLVHLRFATHGRVDNSNCHPFKIGKRTYMMHNGVMSHVATTKDPGMSDTWHFAQLATKTFPYIDDVLDDPEFIYEMDMYTDGSRVAVMRDDGLVVRYNDEDWTIREDGLIVSNTWSCETKWKYATTGDFSDWEQLEDGSIPVWKKARNAYRDDEGVVYPQKPTPLWMSPGTEEWNDFIGRDDDYDYADDAPRSATAAELSLFTTYSMLPDRLLNHGTAGQRVNNNGEASDSTIQIEMEILDKIDMWGDVSYAPWGLEPVARAVWNAWMSYAKDDKTETTEVVMIEDLISTGKGDNDEK